MDPDRPVPGVPAAPAGDEALAEAAARQRVEVVASDGTVERLVDRASMRAGRLRHRCTYVVVVDPSDRVVVHRRAGWKDVWPDRWDLAFGGVVDPGEDWAVAAGRELLEEAGVSAALVESGGGAYDDDDVSVLGRVFVARHDGPFSFPDGEVVDAARIPVADVLAWIAERPHCPDSVALAGPAIEALARGGGPAQH